jgi:hypothetical protein
MKLTHDLIVNIPCNLVDNEREIYYECIKTLPRNYILNPIYFRWVRTSGIGVSVYAKCLDIEKDITDYSTW